nr:hypothetical protein [Tanacetum cinerariifolium]
MPPDTYSDETRFGGVTNCTIPTHILTTAIIPLVVRDDIPVIPTKTHIIPPVAPEVEADIVTSPAGTLDLLVHSSTDFDPLEDISPSEHAPTLPDTSPFLYTDPSETSSPTHDLSSAVVASLVPCRAVPVKPA